MKVYILEGYFGDAEWIEDVYTGRKRAEAAMVELWQHRVSARLAHDDYRQGLCKFLVYPMETK